MTNAKAQMSNEAQSSNDQTFFRRDIQDAQDRAVPGATLYAKFVHQIECYLCSNVVLSCLRLLAA